MSLFEIGKKYKIMVDHGFESKTILTITIEYEDDVFVKGNDKNHVPRGLRKDTIIDWMEAEQEMDSYGRN
jgi:hypothetical protein